MIKRRVDSYICQSDIDSASLVWSAIDFAFAKVKDELVIVKQVTKVISQKKLFAKQ